MRIFLTSRPYFLLNLFQHVCLIFKIWWCIFWARRKRLNLRLNYITTIHITKSFKALKSWILELIFIAFVSIASMTKDSIWVKSSSSSRRSSQMTSDSYTQRKLLLSADNSWLRASTSSYYYYYMLNVDIAWKLYLLCVVVVVGRYDTLGFLLSW